MSNSRYDFDDDYITMEPAHYGNKYAPRWVRFNGNVIGNIEYYDDWKEYPNDGSLQDRIEWFFNRQEGSFGWKFTSDNGMVLEGITQRTVAEQIHAQLHL